MGFPLIMYLSRSKTIAIWPQLGQKKESFSLRDIKSSLNLSLTPKADFIAEWKKTEDSPIPAEDSSQSWPPHDALKIAALIEENLRKRRLVGSMEEFLQGDFSYPCYKLSGSLVLDNIQQSTWIFGGINLDSHCLTGVITFPKSKSKVKITLALENIAGVRFKDGEWNIWESGANHLFRDASTSEGYPLFGLFTYEGHNSKVHSTCSVVYFASAGVFRFEENKKENKDLIQIAEGL